MKRIYLFIIISLTFSTIRAQGVLDQYVSEAIAQNLQVKEKRIHEQRQAFRVKEASKNFGPEVSFQANYTLAAGGRNIDLPVGSLLNPVYATLNEITETNQFPQIEDQRVQFLPNNFHDVKFRISQPILRPEIKYNKLIREEEAGLASLQTNQTIRDLTRDVKTAYLRWMQAKEVISIIDQGLTLLQENKRVTESLIKNGMAIPSGRMRINSDIEVLEAQRQKAASDVINAAAYFNFLLHRDAGTPILADTFSTVPSIPAYEDVTNREELKQLQQAERIQGLALSLEEKHFAPTLGLQVDIGSQAFGVDWGGYVLGGVGLEIPIWDNKKSNLRRQEYKAGLEAQRTNYEWTKEAFEVQLRSEIETLRADISIYNSYTGLVSSNDRYHQETLRRYKEGLANYIELLDARTQVTNAQLEQNLAKYQSWIRFVNIERIAANSSIQ